MLGTIGIAVLILAMLGTIGIAVERSYKLRAYAF